MDTQYGSSDNYSSSIMDSISRRNGKDGIGYMYKKSSYQYSTSGKNNSSYDSKDRNIDQLDELLEDLKNEREHTKDIELVSSGNMFRTLESERNDSPSSFSKTTRAIKTSQVSGTHKVPMELENNNDMDYFTQKSSRYPSKQGSLRNEEYHSRDINYDSSQIIPQNVNENKEKIYKSSVHEKSESKPSSVVKHSSSTHIPEELKNITLSDDILPIPGVKVTTTVRTYTYEIPADSAVEGGQRSLLYKNNNYNTIQRNEANHIVRSPPPTVVYNTETYSTIQSGEERPIITNQTKEIREHADTTNSYTDHPYLNRNLTENIPNETNKTIIYKVNTTENVHSLPEPMNYRNLPPLNSSVSPKGPTTNRYYYHESNVVNSIHGPDSPHSPNGRVSSTQIPHPMGYPHSNQEYMPTNPPPNASTVVYKYATTTTNTTQGPDYRTNGPYSQPPPFPVENRNFPITNGSPPQKVDDLMQSFGNGDTVDKSDIETPHRKREVETGVASPNQQKIPSVNKAGKDVYYPPGHEMMLVKREEMATGSAAGGRWAKGSGMYEYESGYKSKTKTKSGGAVVPVCLPLCCAMPCSIM